MDTLNFKVIFLGQSVLRYQVPLDIFYAINQIYEQNFHRLAPANKQLVGKLITIYEREKDQTDLPNWLDSL